MPYKAQSAFFLCRGHIARLSEINWPFLQVKQICGDTDEASEVNSGPNVWLCFLSALCIIPLYKRKSSFEQYWTWKRQRQPVYLQVLATRIDKVKVRCIDSSVGEVGNWVMYYGPVRTKPRDTVETQTSVVLLASVK